MQENKLFFLAKYLLPTKNFSAMSTFCLTTKGCHGRWDSSSDVDPRTKTYQIWKMRFRGSVTWLAWGIRVNLMLKPTHLIAVTGWKLLFFQLEIIKRFYTYKHTLVCLVYKCFVFSFVLLNCICRTYISQNVSQVCIFRNGVYLILF